MDSGAGGNPAGLPEVNATILRILVGLIRLSSISIRKNERGDNFFSKMYLQ